MELFRHCGIFCLFFILLLVHSFSDASLILSENSSIDVSTTSEYVIKISCTDGTDTTFFDLTLLFTTDKPKTQPDTTPIIIGASIGGLFLLVVIIVVCVRKRQHKNNDENRVNEKTPHSDGAEPNRYSIAKGFDAIPHYNCGYAEVDVALDGSSDGATPNRYSMAKGFDVISDDKCAYAEVRKCGNADIAKLKANNVEKQPSTSERF